MPRTEVQAKSTQEETGALLRIQEIRKLESDWRLKLGKAEKDFQDTLVKNIKEWEEGEKEHHIILKERKDEIDALEVKKLNMLVPFTFLKERTFSDMKDAQSFLESLRKREEYVEELTENLQDKLDGVGIKDSDLKRQETQILVKEKTLQDREARIISGEEALSRSIINFNEESQLKRLDREQLMEGVIMREQSIISREESVKRTEEAHKKEFIYLTDQREVLNKAFDEVRRREAKLSQAKV